jgi:hypothetical protein
VLAEISFFLLDAFVNFGELIDIGGIQRLCNITREDSLSSWFGSVQTLMVGFTLLLIYLTVRKNRGGSRWQRVGWCVLTVFFIYMAVDDGAEIHERMGSAFKKTYETRDVLGAEESLGERLLESYPSYPWQILFLPVFGCVGVFMGLFLSRELKRSATRALAAAGIICFVAAVGLDFIEGMDKGHPWNLHTLIEEKYELESYTVRHFSKVIEEMLEMLGTTFFWTAFLMHLSRITRRIQIEVVGEN